MSSCREYDCVEHAVDNGGCPNPQCEWSREHVVVRINPDWYQCNWCGQAGSGRWALLHQFREG